MRNVIVGWIAAAMLASVAGLSAHQNFRIVGTIMKVTSDTLVVKQNRDGKVISMRMTPKTFVSRDDKSVDRSNLKIGASVVVEARGDTLNDLQIHAVRLVPPPSKKQEHD